MEGHVVGSILEKRGFALLVHSPKTSFDFASNIIYLFIVLHFYLFFFPLFIYLLSYAPPAPKLFLGCLFSKLIASTSSEMTRSRMKVDPLHMLVTCMILYIKLNAHVNFFFIKIISAC